LRLAGAQNLDVQLAQQKLAEARANKDIAAWQFFPWLTPGLSFRRHEGRIQAVEGTVFDAEKQSYTAGGTVTAQVDLGDAIYKNLAAKQLVKASQGGLEAQRQAATATAAQAYFELAKSRALVEVAREALKVAQLYQEQIHEAVGAGVVFKGDELRIQTQAERSEGALRQAQEQQRLAAVRLAQTLHLDPSVELVPAPDELQPLTLFPAKAALDTLVNQALRSRPEFKEQQALMDAAMDAKAGAVYGPLIPSVGAQVFAGGLGGGRGSSMGNFGSSEDYYIGVGWKLGPGGLFDFGRADLARARLAGTKLAGEKLKDQIIGQVVENHSRMLSLQDQIAIARRNLATASETLKLTRERKAIGVGVVLEDLQAQQELTRARSDYLTAVAEFNKVQYALRQAVGTGE
jgi:OMF family outer membrane factor